MNDGGCQNPPGRPARVLFLKTAILFHPPAEWFCLLLYLMQCIPNAREAVTKSFITVVANVFRWNGSACCSGPA